MAVTQAQVAQLYVALFNRAPEGDGFNAWVRAGANKTQAQIAQEMLNSDAARSYYNGRINQDKDFVEMLYKNILGKDYSQDPSGIDAWVRHIQAGNSRGDTIVKLFEVATSAAARAADPVAAATFANKTEISAYMAQKISQIAQDNSGNYDYTPFQEIIRTTNSTNLTEQKARVDQLANTAYHTLTTGEDTVNGTTKADVINGVISSVVSQNTFNPEDKIDGGSGEDTLNAVMTTNFNGFSGGYLRNVENLNLTNNSGTRKVFNAEGVEGLRKVNIGGDSATRVINLANIIDLSAANVKSGDILLTYNPAIIAGSNDEQNLTLDNVGAATAEGMMSNSIVTTFSGIEKLNITTKGSASYISGVSNKNIVVKGDAALDIALAGTKAAPNGVTTNFDASALNANLSADLVGGYTTLEDVKGGKGNDTFKANINSASVGIFKVNGGDGNDKRGQEQAGGEQAVNGAEDGTGDDGNEQCGGKSGAEGEALCADHAGDGDDGADGEVDFAEEDDPGHAEGGDGDDGDLLEDVHEVRQREEAAVGDGEDGAEDDEGDDDAAVLAQERVAGGGAVRRGHGVVLWRRP